MGRKKVNEDSALETAVASSCRSGLNTIVAGVVNSGETAPSLELSPTGFQIRRPRNQAMAGAHTNWRTFKRDAKATAQCGGGI